MDGVKKYNGPINSAITMLVPPPKSCDTFVYVGAPILHKSKKLLTGTGTLFGKNSDRPCEERHEVIRVRPRSYESTTSQKEEHVVQCTYINVPQDKKTLDCVLSRPCWMWGCEMGMYHYYFMFVFLVQA